MQSGLRFSTAAFPQPLRVDFWQDFVCREFCAGEFLPRSRQAFHGEIRHVATRTASLSTFSGAGQQFARTSRHVRRAEHDRFVVLLQLRGAGIVSQDGKDAHLSPGDFACVDSVRPSICDFDADFEQLVVHLPREPIVGPIGRTERLTAEVVRAGSPIGALISPYLRRLASVVDQVQPRVAERLAEVAASLIDGALGEITGIASKSRGWSRTALLYRAKAFIDAHAADHALAPERVAVALGISVRYLQAVFRDEATTPSDWIWARRLEKSRRMLTDPVAARRTVSEIALATGFSDSAHFSRRFRAAFGLSPSEYRARRGVQAAPSGSHRTYSAGGNSGLL